MTRNQKRAVVKSSKFITNIINPLGIGIAIYLITATYNKVDKTHEEQIKLQSDYNMFKYMQTEKNECFKSDILDLNEKYIWSKEKLSYICNKLKIKNHEDNNRD